MKKTRIKTPVKPALTLATREGAEACMRELAEIANERRYFIAKRDAQLLEINESWERPLAQCEEQITARTLALQQWAEANPDAFPKGRKSLDLVSGTIGFRTGTPKLALVSRAWNWEKVLGILKSVGRWVRVKEEPDKESILAEYSAAADKNLLADQLRPLGMKVTQEESFFVEPALADTDARQTTQAGTSVGTTSRASQTKKEAA